MAVELWRKLANGKVQCLLCRHNCTLGEGKKGICSVRAAQRGRIFSLVPDIVASAGLDPIEKKPLYHYLPGTKTYSFGTCGCNFACQFCQNHFTSRAPSDRGVITGKRTTADILIGEALKSKAESIAFTYNEPTIFYELMFDVTSKASLHELDCIMVTNGYQTLECLSTLYNRIKAVNVDLKSMSDGFYRKYCAASLAPVLENLKVMVNMGWWVEVTTLVIPGLNDSEDELRDAARFIRQELGPHVPWHLSRFHGAYNMLDRPPTPIETLERARNIGFEEGLYYVYVGNTGGVGSASTMCPDCKSICISREGFFSSNSLKKGNCPKCGRKIEGVWSKA